jgi:rhodanese-related sulfurtransferase
MLNAIKKLMGMSPKVDFSELLKKGGIILDVRSKGEYQGSHIKGSVNIPVDDLRNNLSMLIKEKPIITCCASGIRSATAKNILKSNGFTEVHNGGGWKR